jgi:hypothetical protein
MTDSDEGEYLLNEGQTWFLTLVATPEDGAKNAIEIKHEVVKVLMAWRRGKLLPRWEVPHLAGFCDESSILPAVTMPEQELSPASAGEAGAAAKTAAVTRSIAASLIMANRSTFRLCCLASRGI